MTAGPSFHRQREATSRKTRPSSPSNSRTAATTAARWMWRRQRRQNRPARSRHGRVPNCAIAYSSNMARCIEIEPESFSFRPKTGLQLSVTKLRRFEHQQEARSPKAGLAGSNPAGGTNLLAAQSAFFSMRTQRRAINVRLFLLKSKPPANMFSSATATRAGPGVLLPDRPHSRLHHRADPRVHVRLGRLSGAVVRQLRRRRHQPEQCDEMR
jgi:hypothetical protein